MKQATVLLDAFTLFVLLVLPTPIVHSQDSATYRVHFSPHGGCTEAIISELAKAKT